MNAARRLVDTQRAGGGAPIIVAVLLSVANLMIPGAAKAVLGLPLALWAPGYCVVILIFGRAIWVTRFDAVIRLAVICVLSMAVWPLLILAAYVVHPRVTSTSVELGFAVLATATVLRVHVAARAPRAATAPPATTPRPPFASRRLIAPLVGVAVIALGGALTALLASTLPPQQTSAATAVSLTGTAATDGAPLARTDTLLGSVAVTIDNPALVARGYRVTVSVDHAETWAGVSVDVGPGAQRDVHLVGALPSTSCLTRATVVVSDGSESLQPLVTYFRGNVSGDCHGD